MQLSVSPNPNRIIGRTSLLLMFITCTLSWALPGTLVFAADGDFVWAKATGAVAPGGGAFAAGITINTSGNVYTVGNFDGTVDFDPGPGTFNLTSAGSNDIFISKLDSSGNFVWAKAMGGISSDKGESIAVDISGNVYTMGSFDNTVDFDPGPAIFNLTSTGGSDNIFISKLDSNGNFIWAKAASAAGYALGSGIAVDTAGNVYTTGSFYLTVDFNPGPATFNLTSARLADIFISKLDKDGNFVWAKSFEGGTSDDFGYGISVDGSGNVYTTGFFNGPADFDPGPNIFNLTNSGRFISKLDSNGDFVWAKEVSGEPREGGESITVDSAANVYTTGTFGGTADFDPGPDTFDLTSVGALDIFIHKLDSSGNFVWARAMGGSDVEEGLGISVDSSGNVYTTGKFQGTVDFDPGTGMFNLTSAGGDDIFISKLDSSGNFIWAKAIGGPDPTEVRDIAIDGSGNLYTTGFFFGTVDFDPGPETFNMTSSGPDLFVIKLAGTGSTFFWPVVLPAILNNTQP